MRLIISIRHSLSAILFDCTMALVTLVLVETRWAHLGSRIKIRCSTKFLPSLLFYWLDHRWWECDSDLGTMW